MIAEHREFGLIWKREVGMAMRGGSQGENLNLSWDRRIHINCKNISMWIFRTLVKNSVIVFG